ncbi:MAG: hypothetical protein EA412_06630 [Chitinophagaceae bacterium]|nr:MAG: hypothetical protein EA412_06630 [Chitinophagaceae bacterium]
MGLSIHYSGKFRKNASLPELIEEVREIAEVHKWPYAVYQTDFPENSTDKEEHDDEVYGISFTPPECETIPIEFLSNGRMSNSANLMLWGKAKQKPEKDYLYMNSVKTQFAGIETHKFIIHLFKYLSKKYLDDFRMLDEGRYWETGDEKQLTKIFTQYDNLLDSFASSLESLPMHEEETFEDYILRIVRQVRKKNR